MAKQLSSIAHRVFKTAAPLISYLLVVSNIYALDSYSPDLQQAPIVTNTGVSAIWILANISYAGMRAQNKSALGWRILAFVFGFPGTLVSLILVRGGSERAYGIDLPIKRG